MFKLEPPREQMRSVFAALPQQEVHDNVTGLKAPSPLAAAPSVDDEVESRMPQAQMPSGQPKVGRNDVCPCGSGKKYKKCHGA